MKSIIKHIQKLFLTIINFINPRIVEVRVLFPIGIKLVIIFAIALFTMLILINNLMAQRTSRSLEIITEEANFTVNNLVALEAENCFNSVRKEVSLLLDFIALAGKDNALARQASVLFFERSYFVAALFVPGFTELINDTFFVNNNVNPGSVSSWLLQENTRIENARRGEPVIVNPSADMGVPLIAMFYPWQQNNNEEAMVILFSLDGLAEILVNGSNNSFIVSKEGDLLFHSNYQKVLEKGNVSNHPLVEALLKSESRDIRIIYTENGIKFFGAGEKVSLGDLMIFSTQEYESLGIRTAAIFRRNIFLIGSAIFISIILVWFMSKTLTVPVRRLLEAVSKIEAGDFEVDLKYRFPDELGLLSERFNKMGKTLAKTMTLKPIKEKALSEGEEPPAAEKQSGGENGC